MKRFLPYFFISLFLYFFISSSVVSVQAACNYDKYMYCTGTCSCQSGYSGSCFCSESNRYGECLPDFSRCRAPTPTSSLTQCERNGGYCTPSTGECGGDCQSPDSCNGWVCCKPCRVPTPTIMGGSYLSPTSVQPTGGSDCTVSDPDCKGGCAGLPSCSYVCTGDHKCYYTYTTNQSTPAPTPVGGACCSSCWGPWRACYQGYAARFCNTLGSFEFQITQCVPDVTGAPGGGVTPPPPGATIPLDLPTAAPTLTPTPTPGVWIKLKNTSFSSDGSIIQAIPVAPVAYDADDDGSANFIAGEGGLVDAPVIDFISANSSAKPSANNWSVAYSPNSYSLSASSFLSYIKARKSYTEITSLDEINKDGIYIYTGASPLNIAAIPSSLDNYKVVISTDAVVNISLGNFNPVKSVAIVASAINFSDTTTEAAGIFIADSVTTGTNAGQGLKIIGNLAALTSFTNDRSWADINKPAIFIYFNQQKYLDLLPYLSIANYEWRQIQ